jgi:DNA-binding IscR family transcriptional regulator
MPRPKLSTTQVKRIKVLLMMKDENGKPLHTHEKISKKYGVKRPCISKIAAGMRDPFAKNGRWGDIEIGN